MKVMLLKDIHKLGRAGDVKRVANGYGRNYLIPQGIAVLATPGALKQAEHIRTAANTQRTILNNEMGGVAEILQGKLLIFAAKASETGKLYGSVTTRMIADAIQRTYGVEVDSHQVDTQPLRALGEFAVPVRLTMDLAPKIMVIVHREGETPELPGMEEAEEIEEAEELEAAAEEEIAVA